MVQQSGSSTVSPQIRTFWFATLLSAAFLLALVIATALVCNKIRRMSAWFNFCFAWMVSAISYSLLAFSGTPLGKNPPLNLCLTQAALIYAAPVLDTATGIAWMLQLWFATSAFMKNGREQDAKRRPEEQTLSLLVLPYIAYLTVVVINFEIGIARLDTINIDESGLYCSHGTRLPGIITNVLSAIGALVILVLEGLCVRHHYRIWRSYGYLESARPTLGLLIRVVTFSTLDIIVVAITCVHLINQTVIFSEFEHVILAMVHVACLLLFGLSGDIVHTWVCWKSCRKLWFCPPSVSDDISYSEKANAESVDCQV
ncbi:hypothetical protein PUNSTDRAFT_120572 [Punctularia strigosozonata HHB-11173 SS5]|uniref:uncharacterized protein n=1 Tax=Punctularia strigosozonata (strain HHB-11173) TaxID=741275 RepID=UPI000441675E|nr:uncharacterized protein PUNSTDRAFT_120572 [Punctularia strigosozonata HHB-11173 SS5]EIN09268.1 hypothetical protein PUNSTDRAFT_120572 [Punctularia strigosozonata HHB-11173 SS5]